MEPSIRVTRNGKVFEIPFFASENSPNDTSLQLRLDPTEQLEQHDLVPSSFQQPILVDLVSRDESDNQIVEQTPGGTSTVYNEQLTPVSAPVTDESVRNLRRSKRCVKPPDFYGIPIQSSIVEEVLYSRGCTIQEPLEGSNGERSAITETTQGVGSCRQA